jgi:hypothetical protein
VIDGVFTRGGWFKPPPPQVCKILSESSKGVRGARVEHNRFCVTIHFRRVKEEVDSSLCLSLSLSLSLSVSLCEITFPNWAAWCFTLFALWKTELGRISRKGGECIEGLSNIKSDSRPQGKFPYNLSLSGSLLPVWLLLKPSINFDLVKMGFVCCCCCWWWCWCFLTQLLLMPLKSAVLSLIIRMLYDKPSTWNLQIFLTCKLKYNSCWLVLFLGFLFEC